MVNTQNLENLIKDSGKTKVFLAEKCGITPQSLDNKIKNRTDFKVPEMLTLRDELGMKNKQMSEIFLT